MPFYSHLDLITEIQWGIYWVMSFHIVVMCIVGAGCPQHYTCDLFWTVSHSAWLQCHMGPGLHKECAVITLHRLNWWTEDEVGSFIISVCPSFWQQYPSRFDQQEEIALIWPEPQRLCVSSQHWQLWGLAPSTSISLYFHFWWDFSADVFRDYGNSVNYVSLRYGSMVKLMGDHLNVFKNLQVQYSQEQN